MGDRLVSGLLDSKRKVDDHMIGNGPLPVALGTQVVAMGRQPPKCANPGASNRGRATTANQTVMGAVSLIHSYDVRTC